MSNSDQRNKSISLTDGITYAENSVISKTLLDKRAGTLTLFSFDAGQGLSEHTSPYDATVIVTEGTATLIIAGEAREVCAGEIFIMPANIPHAVKAVERFKMLLVMIREKVND